MTHLLASLKAGKIPVNFTVQNAYLGWRQRKKEDLEFCLGCSEDEYQILCVLAEKLQPTNILEIGPGMGASTFSVLTGADLARVQQVDILPQERGQTLLTAFQRKQLSCFHGSSADYFKLAVDVRFQLIFIDGEHQDPMVTADIISSLARLDQGGVLVCHDIFHPQLEHIGIAAAREAKNRGKQYLPLRTNYGLGIIY